MSLMNVLGPEGRPMVSLGGADAWRQWTHGDIVVSLQWYDCGHEDGAEPCMVLFPAARRDAGAFVIPQASAYKYGLSNGYATKAAVKASSAIAMMLGFDANDVHARHRIVTHIVDHLPELIAMPSQAPAEQERKPVRIGGEVTVTAGGQIMHQETV